ncbi:Similar to tmem205: Transmembrane protein 205 (Xenopus laevis) [Cotesia congregata]|uniref:Similar to tmem205: Transmembrane protein 205 (Xenopus laevis) n=1 Tax=Cotesia congregata TaxID=51543 RepID=A0A8J2MXJ3_COTCN|nr:Similar to tmem205: Transmembrane protein 205 (Xenopus laevis) [Cotesia congregata]
MCIRTCTTDGVELEDNSLAKVVENPAALGLDSSVEIQNSAEVITQQDPMNSVEEIKKISEEVTEKPESPKQCPFAAQRKVFKGKDKFIKKYEEIMNQNQNSEPTSQDNSTRSQGFLGKAVASFKKLTDVISYYCNINPESRIYKILSKTTQPAHVIMIGVVLYLYSIFNPSSVNQDEDFSSPHSGVLSFIYLSSFIIHIGSQFWMTFVSGLSLYFALPRHTFNDVQRVLFPRYFTINACLSFITLVIFVKHHPVETWDTETTIQVAAMSLALMLELLIRLYLTPPLLRLIDEKKGIEQAAGVGKETGCQKIGALKDCPHYMEIHRSFRKTHGCIAMGNVITMGCTIMHLFYISNKLCVLI